MKKYPHLTFKQWLLYILWFILGLLVGYYLGIEHGWKKNVYPTVTTKTATICDALVNLTPKSGDKVTSPLTVRVTIDNTKSCKWTVFEAQAGRISLADSKGNKIGTASLTTTDDWMTDQPVVYTGTIEFIQTPASSDLTLVIYEERPSSEGETNGQSVTIPLRY